LSELQKRLRRALTLDKRKKQREVFWAREQKDGTLVTFYGEEQPVLYSRRVDASDERWDGERVVKVRLLREEKI
jgi:hypothetical protein